MDAKFDPGRVVGTPAALDAIQQNGKTAGEYLKRHFAGDWGDLEPEDKEANESALKTGARLMSVYPLPDGTKIWIITDAEIDEEHHRYATTVLLPEEY